jgi:hypothetical protein
MFTDMQVAYGKISWPIRRRIQTAIGLLMFMSLVLAAIVVVFVLAILIGDVDSFPRSVSRDTYTCVVSTRGNVVCGDQW